MLASLSWVAACLVFVAWPHADSVSVRLVIASAIQFGFLLAVAARLRRSLS